MIPETHACPGCGGALPVAVFACRSDYLRLPVELRRVLDNDRAAHDARAQAEAAALGWYAERAREDRERPQGTRKTDGYTTYDWTGSIWRLVPRSELDAEAWKRSRERPV